MQSSKPIYQIYTACRELLKPKFAIGLLCVLLCFTLQAQQSVSKNQLTKGDPVSPEIINQTTVNQGFKNLTIIPFAAALTRLPAKVLVVMKEYGGDLVFITEIYAEVDKGMDNTSTLNSALSKI